MYKSDRVVVINIILVSVLRNKSSQPSIYFLDLLDSSCRLRIDFNAILETYSGLGQTVLFFIGESQSKISLLAFWVFILGLSVIMNCISVFSYLHVSVAKVEQGFKITRFQLYSLFVVSDCLFIFAGQNIGSSKVVLSFRIVWIDIDKHSEMIDGFFISFSLFINDG